MPMKKLYLTSSYTVLHYILWMGEAQRLSYKVQFKKKKKKEQQQAMVKQ